MSEWYSYIFVRQDISPEQQLIQFGHAACVMGKHLPAKIDPRKLNFVGIGVRNEEELWEVSDKLIVGNIFHHPFNEPDMDDQLTALATSPVIGETRSFFKNYETLRFSPPA